MRATVQHVVERDILDSVVDRYSRQPHLADRSRRVLHRVVEGPAAFIDRFLSIDELATPVPGRLGHDALGPGAGVGALGVGRPFHHERVSGRGEA